MRRKLFSLLLCCTLFSWVGSANATLLGDEITITTALGPQVAIVGPGIEYTVIGGGGGSLNVDFDGAGFFDIFFDVPSDIDLGAPLFPIVASGLDWIGYPLGGIASVIDLGGAIPIANLSWTDNSITLDIVDHLIPQGRSFHHFQIITTHGVPAPATLLLLGFGVTGLVWSRRKRS